MDRAFFRGPQVRTTTYEFRIEAKRSTGEGLLSIKSVFELLVITLLAIAYLSHIPVMAVLAGQQGFRNTRFNIYSLLSFLPFIASGLILLFGPQDLSGRVAISKYLFVVFMAFTVNWLSCMVFLFVSVKDLRLKTKVRAMASASVSFVLSCASVVGASYVTV